MWSIDRIEGDAALCEDIETQERRTIPLAELPPDPREGDILRETPKGWVRAPQDTAERRRELAKRLFKLFGDK